MILTFFLVSIKCSYQEIRIPVASLSGQPVRDIAALSPVSKPSKRVNLTKRYLKL